VRRTDMEGTGSTATTGERSTRSLQDDLVRNYLVRCDLESNQMAAERSQEMSVTEMNGAQAPPADRSRWIALVVLCVGMLMIVLDQTIVNVALPSIQRDLGFSTSNLAWVVNA